MTPGLTRLVIGVCGRVPQRQSIELAVEIGRFFNAQISGLMIEDHASQVVGSIPFAREYVPGRALWQDIDLSDAIAHQENLRRRAQDILKSFVLPQEKNRTAGEITSAAPAELSRSISTNDIMAFFAPAHANEWMSLPFSAFAEAALLTGASSLLLPFQLRRRSGPVLVLASARDVRALETAAHVARRSGERLVILGYGAGFDPDTKETVARHLDLAQEAVEILDIDGARLSDIPRLLVSFNERLLVIGREFVSENGSAQSALQSLIRLSAMRGVPVLIPGQDQAAEVD